MGSFMGSRYTVLGMCWSECMAAATNPKLSFVECLRPSAVLQVRNVEDEIKVGQRLAVRCKGKDPRGMFRLSRKGLMNAL